MLQEIESGNVKKNDKIKKKDNTMIYITREKLQGITNFVS